MEELLTKLNKYIMNQIEICKDILYIDGTKYEAYANKMTFVWKKATDKFYARNWVKVIHTIQELNAYFKTNEIDVPYSIIKEPSFVYLLNITDKLEEYAKVKKIVFVKGKGK